VLRRRKYLRRALRQGPVRIVWLHGWARRGQDFAAAASELARRGVASVAWTFRFRCVDSARRRGGARRYAELVMPALKEIGDGPFVLVGHSFGGTVACVIAAIIPRWCAHWF